MDYLFTRTSTLRKFTYRKIYGGTHAGRHTYCEALHLTRTDECTKYTYQTLINGHSLKFEFILMDAEPGDTCACAEVNFLVDDDYDKVPSKGLKVRATKWLISVWKEALSELPFGEFYCDPHDGDGNKEYREKIFSKFGFKKEYGMMVRR